MQLAFHLVARSDWRVAPARPYAPASLEAEGFIHLTRTLADVIDVANAFYRDDPRPYLLLTVDLDATGSPWQADGDERYPHVHGPIDRRAVVALRELERTHDGRFRRP